MAQLTKDEVLNQIEMTEAGATLAERLLADEELRAAIMKKPTDREAIRQAAARHGISELAAVLTLTLALRQGRN